MTLRQPTLPSPFFFPRSFFSQHPFNLSALFSTDFFRTFLPRWSSSGSCDPSHFYSCHSSFSWLIDGHICPLSPLLASLPPTAQRSVGPFRSSLVTSPMVDSFVDPIGTLVYSSLWHFYRTIFLPSTVAPLGSFYSPALPSPFPDRFFRLRPCRSPSPRGTIRPERLAASALCFCETIHPLFNPSPYLTLLCLCLSFSCALATPTLKAAQSRASMLRPRIAHLQC